MYRAALRSAPRIAAPLRQPIAASGRRFASTGPASQKRSWKSSAVRWALAVGAVYYYSTSSVFAEEPQLKNVQPPPEFSDEDLPTVEAVVAQKRREAEARLQKAASNPAETQIAPASVPTPEAAASASQTVTETPANEGQEGQEGGPEALQEEAAQQGAFNPETGEINWDCPCLGGMAHGPCGEEFKAAFSCFVYSNEEPKGMDCIDKFQHMQDCFRLHPEVYEEELADDDEAASDAAPAGTIAARDASAAGPADTATPESSSDEPVKTPRPAEAVAEPDTKKVEEKPEGKKETASPSAPTTARPAETTAEPDTKKVEEKPEGKKEAAPPSTPTTARPAETTAEPGTKKVEEKPEVSYADVAASGPAQSPQEAAAPQPPEIALSETSDVTSLVDVDTPSVRTVPSDYRKQEVQTETQEKRQEREEEEAARARAEADLAKKKRSNKQKKEKSSDGAVRARSVDDFLTSLFANLSDGAATAIAATNIAAVVGVSTYLGYKALGLYERGRLTWQKIGLGTGALIGLGLFETVLGTYLYKREDKIKEEEGEKS
ncbi:hypothetical protein F4861DRAFT_546844 [Xylaria intraflava]|nr:hypothetical protein F4861DRAFT_546844 [Xylaria intraflava]